MNLAGAASTAGRSSYVFYFHKYPCNGASFVIRARPAAAGRCAPRKRSEKEPREGKTREKILFSVPRRAMQTGAKLRVAPGPWQSRPAISTHTYIYVCAYMHGYLHVRVCAQPKDSATRVRVLACERAGCFLDSRATLKGASFVMGLFAMTTRTRRRIFRGKWESSFFDLAKCLDLFLYSGCGGNVCLSEGSNDSI